MGLTNRCFLFFTGTFLNFININNNWDILSSNDDMAFFEFDTLTERDKYKNPFVLLKNTIEVVRNDYDYILIDTPPNLGLTQGNTILPRLLIHVNAYQGRTT